MSRKFTKDHEWIEPAEQQGRFRVGVTDYAQNQLGDVVAVELPKIGQQVEAGGECAVIESVKAASDIYAPIAGIITAVNDKLADAPELVNQEAEAGGWLFELEGDIDSAVGLMEQSQYDRCTG